MRKSTLIVAIVLSLSFSFSALYARGPYVFFGGYYGYPYHAYPFYPYSYYRAYPYGYSLSYPFYPYFYYYAYPYSSSYESYDYIQPQVFVEPQQDYYWYYCKNPEGYYPYVASCPAGWVRVDPAPSQPGIEKEKIK